MRDTIAIIPLFVNLSRIIHPIRADTRTGPKTFLIFRYFLDIISQITLIRSMPLTLEKKQEVIKKYQSKNNDTGSPEVQVALITELIASLSEHFKRHPKDHNSKYGLLKLIGQRSALLKYLSAQSPARYQKLIKQLGIRK